MTQDDPTQEQSQKPAPKLHIDSDWKAQAQAEKDRLAKMEQEREKERPKGGRTPGAPVGPDELPPADFRTLVGVLASQAVMSLGGYADPQSGRVIVDLQGARLTIDLLGVLEEKTKGNLATEEADELRQVLAELRSRFVHFANLVAQQQQRMAADPTAGAVPPGSGAAPTGTASPKDWASKLRVE
jgi:hypothetical protein